MGKHKRSKRRKKILVLQVNVDKKTDDVKFINKCQLLLNNAPFFMNFYYTG